MSFWRNNAGITPPSAGINVQEVFGIARSIGPASPTFNISGWSQYGLNSNTLRSQIDNNFQPTGTATKVWGNHLVKFGADLRKNQFNIYNPGTVSLTATTNPAGQAIFNSPGFGIITAARAARFIQLVARIEF